MLTKKRGFTLIEVLLASLLFILAFNAFTNFSMASFHGIQKSKIWLNSNLAMERILGELSGELRNKTYQTSGVVEYDYDFQDMRFLVSNTYCPDGGCNNSPLLIMVNIKLFHQNKLVKEVDSLIAE